MVFYLLISVLYCAVFVAFMKTKEDDRSYVDGYHDWHAKYLILCLLGTLLWPLVIPYIIFYKIAFKILKKTNKN